MYGTYHPRSKFTRGTLVFKNPQKAYIELKKYKERYELGDPGVSPHNLVIGTPYLDITGTIEVRNLSHPNKLSAKITYYPRGWGESTYYTVVGEVYSADGEVAYRIDGKWNSSVNLINCKTG